MSKKQSIKKICFIMTLVLLLQAVGIYSPVTVQAARNNILQLAQVQKLAIFNSAEVKKIKNQIILQKVKYVEAVKSVQLKQKNMSTFRWTPLLSFKFPTKPDMVESYEFIFKPLQVQTKITSLQHQLTDTKYGVTEEVGLLFTSLYVYQEKIAFQESALKSAVEELKRNKAKLLIGQASKQDISRMEKSVKTITSDLALLKRSFETSKIELTDMIKIDVSSGYTFKNPLVGAEISRDSLDSIIEYTLDNSQTYFDAKLDSQASLSSLNTYESLMQGKYGSAMNYIQSYINQAKSGSTINYESYKTMYDQMLTVIDAPWQGTKRILFFKIPKEWFKGDIDGIRYVEDEPYALYTASMEYEEAVKAQEKTKKDITKNVESSFEAIVTAKNAYEALQENVAELKVELSRLSESNKLGVTEYEEVKDKQEEYQTSQLDAIEALATYSELLFSFDRLTCGAITLLLKGEGLTSDAGSGGDSFVTGQSDKVQYYIQSKVEDSIFLFGLTVPKDYEPEFTDYEIWYEGVRIGNKTGIDKQIIHLTLVYGDPKTMKVRLYNGDEFVADCEIDPTVTTGVLDIKDGRVEEKATTKKVGTYELKTNTNIGLAELKLIVNSKEKIKYYNVTNSEGINLYNEQPISIDTSLPYLSLLSKDISSIKVKLYNDNKELVYDAVLDAKTQSIIAEIKE